MRNINWKALIWVLVGLSVVVWAILLYLLNIRSSDIWDALRLLPTVVTLDVGAWLLFVKWGWKFPLFQGWLVPFPVLEGTWQGELQSTWVNPATRTTTDPVPVVLVIKQTFLSTSLIMYSEEMVSRSYSTQFLFDSDNGLKKLVFTYTSVPRVEVRGRSRVHDGTAVLEVVKKPERMLRGEYWTNRQTAGDIKLCYQSCQILEDFPRGLTPTSTSSSTRER